jgi:pseudaminic acid cytidylyltransferase
MIAWAIEAAIRSDLFDRVLVSTDDDEIAEISIHYGAEVPFRRPENLSDDMTPTVPVIAHAVAVCDALGTKVDLACCIYACNPFLQPSDLAQTLDLLRNGDSDFSYPIVEYSHPVQRAMRHLSTGTMQFLNPENELTRTQDLEKTFHDAGQFYWGKAPAWLLHKRMHSSGLGFQIPSWRVVDIDSNEDWQRAELIHSALFQQR